MTTVFFGDVGATALIFDPWVVFDDDSQRFFIAGIDIASDFESNVYLAVSTTPTPTDGTDWHKYRLDFTHDPEALGLGIGAHFPDYVKLGVSDDAVFVSGNYFTIDTGTGFYSGITAIEKSGTAQRRTGEHFVRGVLPGLQYLSFEPIRFGQHPVLCRIHWQQSDPYARRNRCVDQSGFGTPLIWPSMPTIHRSIFHSWVAAPPRTHWKIES